MSYFRLGTKQYHTYIGVNSFMHAIIMCLHLQPSGSCSYEFGPIPLLRDFQCSFCKGGAQTKQNSHVVPWACPCVHMGVNVCTRIWRPEAAFGVIPQSLSTWFYFYIHIIITYQLNTIVDFIMTFYTCIYYIVIIFPSSHSTLIFEKGSLTGLEFSKLTRLADQPVPGILLSLLLQWWDYKRL